MERLQRADKTMKRIGLFLGVEPHAGGMFQYAQSLLDALQALPPDSYEVRVACASASWHEALRDYSFTVTTLPHGRRALRLAMLCMLLRLPATVCRALLQWGSGVPSALQAQSCDLWIFPAQDAIAWQAGVPFIASIHDLMHRYEPHFPEVSGFCRRAIREHRFQKLCRHARALLVDSEVGKKHVMESYGVAAQKIFPLPYVSPRHMDAQVDEEAFNRRYRLPEKFLFYPAQFWAHKNHARLIEALAMARRQCPDMALVLTGGRCHEYPRVAAQVERMGLNGCVHFMGYVPDADLPGFYRRARALVMPTFFGPTNIPPLEALACGCPMAVSGIYAMPEQLGDASLYFDPRDMQDMAQNMVRLWNDDALVSQMRARGVNRLALWRQADFNRRLSEVLDILYVTE